MIVTSLTQIDPESVLGTGLQSTTMLPMLISSGLVELGLELVYPRGLPFELPKELV
jgi:hypothetical protein